MRLKKQKGFALITLIFAMVLIAALGAGIYALTTSSTFSELLANSGDKAYQLAKAGIRYAANSNSTGTFLMPDNNNKFTIAKSGNVITSTGIVNEGTFLEARRVLTYTMTPAPTAPANNENILLTTFEDLTALDLSKSGSIISIKGYVATGGTHVYWAAFTGAGGYYYQDPEMGSTSRIGYHVVPISNVGTTQYRDKLQNSWNTYTEVDYDTQVKVGWYLTLQYGVTGISFRWRESPTSPGKYEGYGLSFMRYNNNSGRQSVDGNWYTGGDGIPNGIKPPGLSGKSLLVLWRQKVVSGVETKQWLAYAVLGDPYNRSSSAATPDPKVVGNQGWPDGIGVSDNSALNIRIEDNVVDGQRLNRIKLVYGDASPNYTGAIRNRDAIATNIQRGRYSPQWIDNSLFPHWPSNVLDPTTGTITNWHPDKYSYDWYDYFTLTSTTPQTPNNNVNLVVNTALVKTTLPCNTTDVMCLLDDKATIQTTEFILDTYPTGREEIGLHTMGYLAGQTMAFDDFAIQILGVHE